MNRPSLRLIYKYVAVAAAGLSVFVLSGCSQHGTDAQTLTILAPGISTQSTDFGVPQAISAYCENNDHGGVAEIDNVFVRTQDNREEWFQTSSYDHTVTFVGPLQDSRATNGNISTIAEPEAYGQATESLNVYHTTAKGVDWYDANGHFIKTFGQPTTKTTSAPTPHL